MGYETYFNGKLEITPQLQADQVLELNNFCSERHEGASFPGIWCDYRTSGDTLEAIDGKNYEYESWLGYLIRVFFEPWSRKLNGVIYWEGEESDDLGAMKVTDNVISIHQAEITYPGLEA